MPLNFWPRFTKIAEEPKLETLMRKWIFILTLTIVLLSCRVLLPAMKKAQISTKYDEFIQSFESPDCSNPCWLGIEVGVTSKKDTIVILQEYGINFFQEGYGGNIFELYSIPDKMVPGLMQKSSEEPIFAIINVTEDGGNIVHSIGLYLDICVSTIIDIYGPPKIWIVEEQEFSNILIYPDRGLFFSIDENTLRTDLVILHMKETIPPNEELVDWTELSRILSKECTDILLGTHPRR